MITLTPASAQPLIDAIGYKLESMRANMPALDFQESGSRLELVNVARVIADCYPVAIPFSLLGEGIAD